MKKAKIYLIPNTLGPESPISYNVPVDNIAIIAELRHFVVEHIKDARRFLVKLGLKEIIDQSQFYELNQHEDGNQSLDYIKVALQGNNMGIISDAGCPGVADPGARLVSLAHENQVEVVPLVGPSSILMALMASGFNGQSFAFHGYLDREKDQRLKKIRFLEERAQREKQTQLFMDTPYRNEVLYEDLLNTLSGSTLLLIACDISLPTQYIRTKTVAEWKKTKKASLNKRPVIFAIYPSGKMV